MSGQIEGVTLIVWILVILIIRNSPEVNAAKTRVRSTFRANTEKVTVTLGGNSLVVPRAALEKQAMEPLSFGDSSPLKIYIENGFLFVDATLFTRQNFPPFQMRHNEYDNLPPQWDVNSTDTILELVNDVQVPMLQIIHKSESEVEINGVFLDPNGVLIASHNGMRNIPIKAVEVIAVPITRIFKYPSFQHPGEFEQ